MATQTIPVRMARASDEDIQNVMDFFKFIDEFSEYGTETFYPGEDNEEQFDLDEKTFAERLLHHWKELGIGHRWNRVVWGCDTLIKNAADPELSYLEFKPEILAALAAYRGVEPDTFGCYANTIITAGGLYLDYADPKPEQIEPAAIVRGLSRESRFANQTERTYTVAEHCILGCKLISEPECQLAFMLHDAAEAFMRDLPKPLKNMLPGYSVIADRLQRVIEQRFELDMEPWRSVVKDVDRRMLVAEKQQLWPNDPNEWIGFASIEPAPVTLSCYAPAVASSVYSQQLSTLLRDTGRGHLYDCWAD